MAELFKKAQVRKEEINPVLLQEPMVLETHSCFCDTEIEELKKQAYQQGYCAGKEEEQEINEQTAVLKQNLETLLAAIPKALADLRLDLNTEIAPIIIHIVKHYFSEQITNPKALESQINQILSQINHQQKIELYLHPDDLTALQKGKLHLQAAALNNLMVKSDDALSLGGCVIKSEHGIFDASIERQIDRLKQFLLEIKQGDKRCIP